MITATGDPVAALIAIQITAPISAAIRELANADLFAVWLGIGPTSGAIGSLHGLRLVHVARLVSHPLASSRLESRPGRSVGRRVTFRSGAHSIVGRGRSDPVHARTPN
jgi:hypothetical protein